MRVLLTIWISAVLIQEIVPSSLVRLPRNAKENVSLVHTEYEAKYEQKGQHGNESYSTVTGKQEIVHNSCGESWSTFAEKCSMLIKDLVVSLANAVSSKPGDATKLQLQIKNSFKHFDNSHNCSLISHLGKNSDFDLPLSLENLTIKTIGPEIKCGVQNAEGIRQNCNGQTTSPVEDGIQSGSESHNEQDKTLWEKPKGQKQPKQSNSALIDRENVEMNLENAGDSSEQSTSNSRRQIKDPSALGNHQQIDKNSEFASSLSKANQELLQGSKSVSYPFFATSSPIPQSFQPSESLSPPFHLKESSDTGPFNSAQSDPSHASHSPHNSHSTPKGYNSEPGMGTPIKAIISELATGSQKPSVEVEPASTSSKSPISLTDRAKTELSGTLAEDEIIDDYGSTQHSERPVASDNSESKPQRTLILPKVPAIDSHSLTPLSMIQEAKTDQNLMPSVPGVSDILSEPPMVTLPEKPSQSNLSSAFPEVPNQTSSLGEVLEESHESDVVPEEHKNNQDFSSPTAGETEKPILEPRTQQPSFTTPNDNDPPLTNGIPVLQITSPHGHFPIQKELSQVLSDPQSYSSHSESLTKEDDVSNSGRMTNVFPFKEPNPTDSASSPLFKPNIVKDSATLSPEYILPVSSNDQDLLNQNSATLKGVGENGSYNTVRPQTATESKETNQQIGDLPSINEQLSNPRTSDECSAAFSKPNENTQYSTPETRGLEEEQQFDSQQPRPKIILSTPSPIYPVKPSNAVFPTAADHLKPAAADYYPKETVFGVTEAPSESIIPGNQEPNAEGKIQNEHEFAPKTVLEIPRTSTFLPEKSFPGEIPIQGNSNFTTPAPIYLVTPIRVIPNSNEGATPLTGHGEILTPPHKQHENSEYPRVSIQPGKISEKAPQKSSHYPKQTNDFSSASPPTLSSDNSSSIISSQSEIPILSPVTPHFDSFDSSPEVQTHQEEGEHVLSQPTTFQTSSEEPTTSLNNLHPFRKEPGSFFRPTTLGPKNSDETIRTRPATSKTTVIHEHEDDEEDCCSFESYAEEEITDPNQYKENACKNLEEARRELKSIFDKIKKKLKCGKKVPDAINR